MLQDEIVRYLGTFCKGRRNAQPKIIIMQYLNIKDERLFRELVHQLRLQGVPILSRSQRPYGYFFAETIEETAEALRELNGRALDIHRVIKFIKRGLREQFPNDQLPLFGEEIQNDNSDQRT